MGRVADEFRAGQKSAKITNYRDAILRAFLTLIAVAVAWVSPVQVWAKIPIFFVVLFIIGFAVQYRKVRVESDQSSNAAMRRWQQEHCTHDPLGDICPRCASDYALHLARKSSTRN